MNFVHFSFLIFSPETLLIPIKYILLPVLKCAKTTCVEIANEMKKCSGLKDMPNFNVL